MSLKTMAFPIDGKRRLHKCAVYLHGKGGSADEAERFAPLLDGWDVIGFDYKAETPWEAATEFPAFVQPLRDRCDTLVLIANSIGAYFAMHALQKIEFDRSFFISPIVDMEALILSMLAQAGVSQQTLRQKKVIPTAQGEPLSWDYLCYVRQHPLQWDRPTEVLFGENDALTPLAAITSFCARSGARLTVMPQGEHWFHTSAQLAFLDRWFLDGLKKDA